MVIKVYDTILTIAELQQNAAAFPSVSQLNSFFLGSPPLTDVAGTAVNIDYQAQVINGQAQPIIEQNSIYDLVNKAVQVSMDFQ